MTAKEKINELAKKQMEYFKEICKKIKAEKNID